MLKIEEATLSVSSAGAYGSQAVLNVLIRNQGLLPRFYTLKAIFHTPDGTEMVAKKTGILAGRSSKYITLETYTDVVEADVYLTGLLGFRVYDTATVKPS